MTYLDEVSVIAHTRECYTVYIEAYAAIDLGVRNRCVCVQAVICAGSHLGKGQLWVAVGSQLAVQRSCVVTCVVTYYGHG